MKQLLYWIIFIGAVLHVISILFGIPDLSPMPEPGVSPYGD